MNAVERAEAALADVKRREADMLERHRQNQRDREDRQAQIQADKAAAAARWAARPANWAALPRAARELYREAGRGHTDISKALGAVASALSGDEVSLEFIPKNFQPPEA